MPAVTEQFRASTSVRVRHGDRADSLGAFHYDQSLDRYLAAVRSAAEELDHMGGRDSPIERVASEVESALSCLGYGFRVARHGDQPAGKYRISSWRSDGSFALNPHEDFAQTKTPEQEGFEVQRVESVFSVNAYVSAPEGAGDLLVWRPEDTEPLIGLGHVRPLPDVPHTTCETRTGDVVILNGKYPHAVKQPQVGTQQDRVVANFFFAPIDDRECIRWI